MGKRSNPAFSGRPEPTAVAEEMRRRAEVRLAGRQQNLLPDTADPAWTDRITHELGVHQIELEMQNEQLRITQGALEASRDRYIDLYENAPVGYVTVGLDGCIAEANPAASFLLGLPRAQLVGQGLTSFIPLADRPRLQQHVATLLRDDEAPAIELTLERPPQEPRRVALQTTRVGDDERGVQVRAALVDV